MTTDHNETEKLAGLLAGMAERLLAAMDEARPVLHPQGDVVGVVAGVIIHLNAVSAELRRQLQAKQQDLS